MLPIIVPPHFGVVLTFAQIQEDLNNMMLHRSVKNMLGITSFAVLTLMAPMASATLLPPNTGTAVLTDYSGVTLGTLAGTLNSPYLSAAAPGQQIGGTLYSRVYSGDSGAIGLDFFYLINNVNGINDAVSQLNLNGFTGFITDVGIRTTPVDGLTAGTVQPSALTVGANVAQRGSTGNTVGFNFGGAQQGTIGVNQASVFLVVRTNATNVTTNAAGVIDGLTVNVPILAPSAVPEPGSIVLFGTCLLGIAGYMRRRNANAQA